MTIFPMIAKLFGQAFRPLTTEIAERYQAKLTEKGQKNSANTWFIAVYDGLGYGESATLISGTILMPIMLVVAMILPGNKMLPIVDLIALPFMLESIVAIHNGNMTKVIATGFVWFSLGLYAGSYMAPMYTLALSHYGIVAAGSLTLVVSYNVMARPLTTLIFAGWISGNYFVLALIVAVYLVAWVFLRLHRDHI